MQSQSKEEGRPPANYFFFLFATTKRADKKLSFSSSALTQQEGEARSS
jgi:hypothetical protein